MNQKNSVSAIIIAKNEDTRIEECLRSVAWANEVIVVDNGSTDKTVEIAKKLNAIIIEQSGANFSILRDSGAKAATGTWLLYLDADEIITKELQKEILNIIHEPRTTNQHLTNGYYISRRNFYLGREWPVKDKMIRLIKKDALIGWLGKLHEHPNILGTVGDLQEPLIHNTHRTLSEMVEKTNQWSEIEADLRMNAKHPRISWWRFLRVMFTAFYGSFIRQKGWKAGITGWVESIYQAFSMFITYAKLWERQQKMS